MILKPKIMKINKLLLFVPCFAQMHCIGNNNLNKLYTRREEKDINYTKDEEEELNKDSELLYYLYCIL